MPGLGVFAFVRWPSSSAAQEVRPPKARQARTVRILVFVAVSGAKAQRRAEGDETRVKRTGEVESRVRGLEDCGP